MALAGEGAVAIWHDIAVEAREEFYAWHGEEHMPERVGIPGFLRGRRYVAADAELEFFNLYEAASPQVLSGTDYQSRLDAPTAWTRATVAHFRNVSRSLCRVAASHGKGCGGLAATVRYDVPDADAARHERLMCEEVLPRLAGERGIAGAHLLVADEAASGRSTAEQRARGDGGNLVPRWIVVVEGWGDEAPFAAQVAEQVGEAAMAGHGALEPSRPGLYRLQATRLKTAFAPG